MKFRTVFSFLLVAGALGFSSFLFCHAPNPSDAARIPASVAVGAATAALGAAPFKGSATSRAF